MLVKINSIDIEEKKVIVTLVDIDDFGSIIPLKDLTLRIRPMITLLLRFLQILHMPLFLLRMTALTTTALLFWLMD